MTTTDFEATHQSILSAATRDATAGYKLYEANSTPYKDPNNLPKLEQVFEAMKMDQPAKFGERPAGQGDVERIADIEYLMGTLADSKDLVVDKDNLTRI